MIHGDQHQQPMANMVMDFLSETLPYSDLDMNSLARLASQCMVDFVPKGTKIMTQGETKLDSLFVIQKGGVKLYLTSEEGEDTLVDFRGEGSTIGVLSYFRESRANLNAETIEDTFFFKIPRPAFADILARYPEIGQFFMKSFSETYVNRAFAEIRSKKVAPRSEGGLYLFTQQVGGMLRREPLKIRGKATIQEAAIKMATEGVGSLFVETDHGLGIVTDKDFRYKVVSMGMNLTLPVELIASAPVKSIDEHAVCFDALLTMMRQGIHHLAVKRNDQIIGMVTSHDIMVMQGRSPFSLFKDISNENRIERLYDISKKIPLVVRALIEEGAKASNINRMITLLNERILERILTLMQEEFGPPPTPFCWLLMGSEGRKEQTFRTDQDNALLYRDCDNPEEAEWARRYFTKFGDEAITHLVNCGFPRCPGDMMASNPKWCQPLSVWKRYFDTWITKPEPNEVMHATIFFDFRPGFGHTSLGDELRDHLMHKVAKEGFFLRFLAQDCLTVRPPMSFFRNFIVEKNGEHRNTLDIKKSGLVTFVDFARLMSLKHGIPQTNTLTRYQRLHEEGHLSTELYREIVEAYEFLMQIRLVHQLRLLEQGQEPNNNIEPSSLTDLEKQTLKEAFSVMGRMQSFVKEMFRLNS